MTTEHTYHWPLTDAESADLKRRAKAAAARGAFCRLRIDPDARTTTLAEQDTTNPEQVGVTLRHLLVRGVIHPRRKAVKQTHAA